MKVGDKVVALISESCIDTIVKGQEYTVKQAFMWENYGLVIVLEGQTPDGGWLVDDNGKLYFEKVEPRSLSKELAEEFIREDIVKEQEIERVFSLNTPF